MRWQTRGLPSTRTWPLAATAAPLLAIALGRAVWALIIVGLVLAVGVAVGSWRARREWQRITSSRLDTDALSEMPAPAVLARADSGLLNADHEKLAVAALRLDELDHPQRTPYLLHALRRAPHHADQLLPRLATVPTAELEGNVELVQALPPDLAEAVASRRSSTRTGRAEDRVNPPASGADG